MLVSNRVDCREQRVEDDVNKPWHTFQQANSRAKIGTENLIICTCVYKYLKVRTSTGEGAGFYCIWTTFASSLF